VQSGKGDSISFTLPTTLTHQIKAQAKISGTTLYVILVATFKVLLHRYTGQKDIWLGSAAAGRSLNEFKNICGCFFNFIVLRSQLEGGQSFNSFFAPSSTEGIARVSSSRLSLPFTDRTLKTSQG
jgi:hypothetical protein